MYVIVSASGCGSVRATPGGDAAPGGDATSGTPTDASVACDPLAPFGAPRALVIPSTTGMLKHRPRLSPDELTLYFSGNMPGQDADLYVTTRASLADGFAAPTPLSTLNSTGNDVDPCISSDGLTFWFASDRVANQPFHIYVSTRKSTLATFGSPAIASGITTGDGTVDDAQPFETADNKEVWFASKRAPNLGAFDIWRAVASSSGFTQPVLVPELNSDANDIDPTLSADRLTFYVETTRAVAGAKGGGDIWRSHRQSVEDGFPPLTLVLELSSAKNDSPSWLSPDNCRIYITQDDGVTDDMYVATRRP
jgi:WD40-like Beta Propeller Repeat